MNALWLVFIYLSVIYPLVRFQVAGIRLLLFFIFLYIIMIAFYHPFPRSTSLSFLASLYLTLFLLVYQQARSARSGATIFNFCFRNKKSQPHHPLGQFSKLPVELRRQIYYYVLGGKLIRVVRLPRDYNSGRSYRVLEELRCGRTTLELFHMLCHSLYVWVKDHCEEPYTSKAIQGAGNDNTQAHSFTGFLRNTDMRSREPLWGDFSNAGLLLLTSRAVYSEAFEILYKTNTFEFGRFHNFLGFSESIPCLCWQSIRSLRIDYRSDGHPINLLQRQDDQRSLRQAIDVIRSMSGLQDLKMRFTHPCETEINLGNMLNLSEIARMEPQLMEQLSRIQLRCGEQWELIVNWPKVWNEKIYTSFYVTRILGRRSSDMMWNSP